MSAARSTKSGSSQSGINGEGRTFRGVPAPAPSGVRLGAESPSGQRWLRVDEAAEVLGVEVITLRRAIERHARRDADGGGIQAHFDGLRARKLGRHWRVLLGPEWSVATPS
jgi:hypothetical protein